MNREQQVEWLEDHWWAVKIKSGRRYLYDPVDNKRVGLNKALKLQRKRNKMDDYFFIPTLNHMWFKVGKMEYQTSIKVCTHCHGEKCSFCFSSGYCYGFQERKKGEVA